jgi:hypothetical protein
MTTKTITTCDSCKTEICSVGTGRKSTTKFRTVQIVIYLEGSNYNPTSTDLHICENCYHKFKALNTNAYHQYDYKENVYQLFEDLLTEMGVAFNE